MGQAHPSCTDGQLAARAKDALEIWQAGVDAVNSQQLVQTALTFTAHAVYSADRAWNLPAGARLMVVGAGKASGGMAAGLEAALTSEFLENHSVQGWVNVPDDCLTPVQHVTLHAARPAGCNHPTAAGVLGARQMLQLVRHANPADLVVVLLSGGGSALLPMPPAEIPLEEKVALTQQLAAAGANIRELNQIRRCLSLIKGGGLLRACRAEQMLVLAISDVLDDDWAILASGPCHADTEHPAIAARRAQHLLQQFYPDAASRFPHAWRYLQREPLDSEPRLPTCRPHYQLLANNQTAVQAAANAARARGYSVARAESDLHEGDVKQVAAQICDWAREPEAEGQPRAYLLGGEPTVNLAPPDVRGQGGRNQQLAVEVLAEWMHAWPDGAVFLSAGTDGEDGNTTAAGGMVTSSLARRARELGLSPRQYLDRNDTFTFLTKASAGLTQLGGLIRTGPTHTNVCDLRVLLR